MTGQEMTNRAEWIQSRARELCEETGLLFYKCLTLAAVEWNARYARLTVVQGGLTGTTRGDLE